MCESNHARNSGQRGEGRNVQQIAACDRSPFPPLQDQEDRGQGRAKRLGQQGRAKQAQDRHIPLPRPGGLEPHPRQHGQQAEQERERVLLLVDPGHAFYLERVQCPHGGDAPRAGRAEAPQKKPHKKGVGRVKRHVHRVEACEVQAPDAVLDPKTGEEDGDSSGRRVAWRTARTRCARVRSMSAGGRWRSTLP